jgi:very-short-patch-repair endonuclease
MTRIFNRKRQKPRRQQLRNDATSAERLLWRYLKGKQAAGAKFRRQHGIGPYIMDFFSHECLLAIEVDGATHSSDEEREHDQRREAFISRHGIKTIRFSNEAVYTSLDGVLLMIEEAVLLRKQELDSSSIGHPTPPERICRAGLPSPQRGEDRSMS